MLKICKKGLSRMVILVALAIFLFFLVNFYIVFKAEPLIYSSVEKLPEAEAVLVLGARVYPDGRISDIFLDRVQTALEVYRSGKAGKILVSGDHGSKDYNEVGAVRDFLLNKGVPAKDIFLDHAGFDTYDSVYRAKNIFQVSSVTISTQRFHLARAVYIAEQLGIKTAGIEADKREYLLITNYQVRELFARIKAFFNVVLASKAEFMGDSIPISGDGRASW